MSREPIRDHRSFQLMGMPPLVLRDVRRRFHRLSPCHGQVAHVLRTLPPVAARVLLLRAAPRLACVKPAASVHPEPGSNSSLYIFLYSLAVLTLVLIPSGIDALDLSFFLDFSVLACTSSSLFNDLVVSVSQTGLQR